ncbi:hypothetical protein C427_2337 [Paraglaciecola psychrophila 170]|uniref:Uncharacterized protein n=1 Tax=Paraglaciecola psychrophila 170 TaxID=1129794 RepID=K6ZPW3_9ALTE|nr:hypothetical protein C427_2337 [Paraglaciecola psychrophila 170]GAC37996.1 hypothetical protein GPSY_2375 [Paraglaciecola psychrophila 170]
MQGYLIIASSFDSKLDIQTPETTSYWLKTLVFSQPGDFLLR